MGTYAAAEVYSKTEEDAQRTIDGIRAAFDRVDASMSNWKEDSELSRLNRAARLGAYAVQDPDLYRCIEGALDVARRSGGSFDPTVGPLMRLYGFRPRAPRVPTDEEVRSTMAHVGWRKVHLRPGTREVRFDDGGVELDLGGIAKGFALDVAVRGLEASSLRAVLLDLGGNLYAWKHPPGLRSWRVGLRDPEDATRLMATLEITDRAVGTSANYENFFVEGGRRIGHHMNPATGLPSDSDVAVATIVAGTGWLSDALGTALLVAGSGRAEEILSAFDGVEAVLLVRGRGGTELLASRSLEDRLRLDAEFAPRVGGAIRFVLPPGRRAGVP